MEYTFFDGIPVKRDFKVTRLEIVGIQNIKHFDL